MRSSNVTVTGGSFSAVAGSQYNYHVQGDLVQLSDPRAGEQSTNWDQYQQLKTGDVRLKKKIAVTEVGRWDERTWRNLDARRTIYIAGVRGEDRREEKEFLYVQYSGPDAVQAFEQDFEAFSTVKSINYAQLFGYINWSRLPALVFYDELVPVSRVFERNKFSSLLYMYFSYSAVASGLDTQTILHEIWIEPSTGTLRSGPYVEDSSSVGYFVYDCRPASLYSDNHPFLNLQAYSNTDDLFEYLIGVLPARSIVEGLRWSNRLTSEDSDDPAASFILSALPGTIYHRTSHKIIARYSGDRGRWYHSPWEERFHIPDTMRENVLVMEDGSVRLMLEPSDVEVLESFWLYYNLHPVEVWMSFANSWMPQAPAIFSQLGIQEDEWGEYSIFGRFWLYFEREWDEGVSHIRANTKILAPIYLFIRPIPRPSDDENKWDAWLGERYYWSLDPSGTTEILENERLNLGLPSFRTSVEVRHHWWDRDAYAAIQMLHRHQRLDFMSMDLARSLGCLMLEVVGDNARFEELEKDEGDHDETEDPVMNMSYLPGVDVVNKEAELKPATLHNSPSMLKRGIQWVRARWFKRFGRQSLQLRE